MAQLRTVMQVLVLVKPNQSAPQSILFLKEGLSHVDFRLVDNLDEFIKIALAGNPDALVIHGSEAKDEAISVLNQLRNSGCIAPAICAHGLKAANDLDDLYKSGFDEVVHEDNVFGFKKCLERTLELIELRARSINDQALIRQRGEQYRYLFENSGDEIYLIDGTLGHILEANPRAAERTGYTHEELLELEMSDILSPEQRLTGFYRFQNICNKGEEIFETEHIRKDGSIYPVEVNARCLVNGSRKIVQAFVRDITHRKKSERLMQESEAKFQELFSSINDVFYHTDMDGAITLISPSVNALLGYKAYELIGRKMASLYAHPSKRHYFLAELMEKGEVRHWETELRHADGRPVFVSSNSILMRDTEGNITGVQGVIRDITDRIEARKQRSEFTKSLEDKVRERTLELERANQTLLREIHEKHRLSIELEARNQDLMDSILYAERLQKAILPQTDILQKTFSDSFVFYKPRDIVGGDFYWFHRVRKNFLLACIDCTGHGVPGGFMTMACNEMLNKTIIDKGWHHPSLVLELMDAEIRETFHRYDSENITDGMDISYVNIDSSTQTIDFAGAGQGLLLVSGQEVTWIRGSKFGLGGDYQGKDRKFETHSISYQQGDCLYLFSDGYADQFGGDLNRKFMMRNFKKLLQSVQSRPMIEQYEVLNLTMERWRGSTPQIDDITVIGIRL